MTTSDRIEDQPWFAEAAAEARAASRRYWAAGGEADQKYPVHEDAQRNWPLGQADTAQPKSQRQWIRRQREA